MPRMHRDRVSAEKTPAAGAPETEEKKKKTAPSSGQGKAKRADRIRMFIQAAACVFFNGYAAGFTKQTIFKGNAKGVCVPVLNCYSCPGALGACPIGALQSILGAQHKVPFYVLGALTLFGVVLGRAVCGFLCPFGFLQDLLAKIPTPKPKIPKKIDRPARFVKYAVLLVLCVGLPVFLTDEFGFAPPFFCKYLCPAGTLEGGVFHLLFNKSLRALAGGLFGWKLGVMLAILAACVFIPRFFCRYLCPLGAFYSLFNRFSFTRMHLDKEKCVDCGKCEQVCPMAVDVRKQINSAECIRCGKCRHACPTEAIKKDKR